MKTCFAPRVLLFATTFFCFLSAYTQIVIGNSASPLEHYAAKELQRYVYQLSGDWVEIVFDVDMPGEFQFVVGQSGSNRFVNDLEDSGDILLPQSENSDQGYTLKTINRDGDNYIVVAGHDDTGVLYGVYGLLEDHFGIGFYFSGDVLPDGKQTLVLPSLDEQKIPAMKIRGFLPWTNFPQSATSYSWEDWKFIIDQSAKMRMNFILVHNYNGELGHNEPFHNFEYQGYMSRVWMPTARTGHSWGAPGWDVNEYLFGATDFFDDYDFGSDCALHNENLSNYQVFRKGVSLFQRVIKYAHSRGVKIGLGLDIDIIPEDYEASAGDPEVVAARVDQIVSDYPDLDYLFCFQSENVGHTPEFFEEWKQIFDGFYKGLKEKSPQIRLAVSGWGLNPISIEALPKDVIVAPIAPYSAGFEDGSIYGDREYWGCPWLERDMVSSQYYYPYNMELSQTIEGYQNRADNMNGFFTLSWRITDAVEPKMWYVSKAPWDEGLSSSEKVYHAYAKLNYGSNVADELTAIINGNEPFANDFAECEPTRPFSTERSNSQHLMNLASFQLADKLGRTIKNVKAASFSEESGTKIKENREYVTDISTVYGINWLMYKDLDFSDSPTIFDAEVASATEGGIIELRLDAKDGKRIGTLEVKNTGHWEKWETVTTEISEVDGTHDLYLVFRPWQVVKTDLNKAERQLVLMDSLINQTNSVSRAYRMNLLRTRIAAARDHIILDRDFEDYTWEDLPGAMDSWIANFSNRVTDISSLGNIVSIQNRFVQYNYLPKVNAFRNEQMVKSPSYTKARGTRDGAIVTWRNEEPDVSKFHVYRGEEKIMEVPYTKTSFQDLFDGECHYSVVAVNSDGEKSKKSIPAHCYAGNADVEVPRINVISPAVSHPKGQSLSMKVTLLDNRNYEDLTVNLYYKKPGESVWSVLPMTRKVKAAFTAHLSGELISDKGLEYYFEASDGTNRSVFPVAAPQRNLSLIAYRMTDLTAPTAPGNVSVTGSLIEWSHAGDEVFQYTIYRSQNPYFQCAPENLVTYVSKTTKAFKDNQRGFDGSPLTGKWYYKVTAEDVYGNESPSSPAVIVDSFELD